MGTRHKVKVIKDNEIIINQYGQWDGYPTTAGQDIVDFLKDKENIEFLNNIKGSFSYKKEEKQKRFIIGEMIMSPEKNYEEIYKFVYDYDRLFVDEETGEKVSWTGLSTKQEVDVIYDKFGFDRTAYYLMITRDTGYRIFDVIKELKRLEPDKKIPIFKNEYEGFDIEARYTINLDKSILKMEWHNRTKTYNLDKLPSEKEIEDFELNKENEEVI